MKGVILNFENQAGAEIEPRPKYRMGEVGTRFRERTDAVEIGHRGDLFERVQRFVRPFTL
jgi:hypothetical protein